MQSRGTDDQFGVVSSSGAVEGQRAIILPTWTFQARFDRDLHFFPRAPNVLRLELWRRQRLGRTLRTRSVVIAELPCPATIQFQRRHYCIPMPRTLRLARIRPYLRSLRCLLLAVPRLVSQSNSDCLPLRIAPAPRCQRKRACRRIGAQHIRLVQPSIDPIAHHGSTQAGRPGTAPAFPRDK